jgi:hypothetical protein
VRERKLWGSIAWPSEVQTFAISKTRDANFGTLIKVWLGCKMSFNNDSFLGGRTARLHYVLKLLLITAIMVLLTVRVANIEYQEAIEYEEGLQTLHEKVRCLADEPSEEFTLAMRSLQATGLGISKRIDRPPTLLIDTYFHIVLAEGQREKGIVSNAMVEAQV